MAKFGDHKFGEVVFGGFMLYISPDIGWFNHVAMLNPLLNPKALEFDVDYLQEVQETPSDVKTPDTMYFQVGDSVYQVPATSLAGFRGSGRYCWKLSDEDVVNYFTLSVEAIAPGKVPSRPNIMVPGVT